MKTMGECGGNANDGSVKKKSEKGRPRVRCGRGRGEKGVEDGAIWHM